MQTRHPLFDDLSRLMTSAAGTFQGARDEMEGLVRTRLERILADMDLVDRESFETVREMAAEARLENERLFPRLWVFAGYAHDIAGVGEDAGEDLLRRPSQVPVEIGDSVTPPGLD